MNNKYIICRELSEFPHLAGTSADYEQAKGLHDFWKSVGLDEVFITPYEVLLSYPDTNDETKMNRIFVYNSTDHVVWQSALYEPILDPSENKSNVVPPFNAYSAPGDINSVSKFVFILPKQCKLSLFRGVDSIGVVCAPCSRAQL